LFGLIFERASIITKVKVGMGTPKAVLMFVIKKQIRQETEQHGGSENLQSVLYFFINSCSSRETL
jgi:hypothetical protein